MKDKSLHVKLVIVSLLKHNLNQRISHFPSFNSTRKVNIDESFGSFTFKPDIACGVAKGGGARSAPGGTFMGAALWAMVL